MVRPPVKLLNGGRARFEDDLEIWCCGAKARLLGNYSLREAGAACTSVGYYCIMCGRDIVVSDAPYGGSPAAREILNAIDDES